MPDQRGRATVVSAAARDARERAITMTLTSKNGSYSKSAMRIAHEYFKSLSSPLSLHLSLSSPLSRSLLSPESCFSLLAILFTGF